MTTRTGGEPDIAAVASLFADRRRARMLLSLAAGGQRSAGELAREAGISTSTASSHLAMLREQGLVTVTVHGRHRWYRLATAEVERILEALAAIAPSQPVSSLREHRASRARGEGRMCSGHLAGRVGVDLFRELVEQGWILEVGGRRDPGPIEEPAGRTPAVERYQLTEQGASALREGDLSAPGLVREAELDWCLDRTAQSPHLAGPLGQAIAERLLERGVVARGAVPRSVTRKLPPGARLVDALDAR
ncbi:helix-turn-helix domain-containing protein [Brachybacterium phenoliresistens]|uniref:ArsR/SmtB family transcription factor n=1 Tax=Brachybacterium phenoliresistens TaxID=396014 RepID=UPI0031D2873F